MDLEVSKQKCEGYNNLCQEISLNRETDRLHNTSEDIPSHEPTGNGSGSCYDVVINNNFVANRIKDESNTLLADEVTLSTEMSNSLTSITCKNCNTAQRHTKSLENSLDKISLPFLNKSTLQQNHLSVCERLNNPRPCYVVISGLLNIILLVSVCVIAMYSNFKFNFERTKTLGPAFCVFNGSRETVCTRDFRHLQFLLHLIHMRKNISNSSEAVQSGVIFKGYKDTKGIFKTSRTPRRQISNYGHLVKTDHILIKQDNNYFISLHLVFKRESRIKDTNGDTQAHLIRENIKTSHQREILMTRTLPQVNGSQALQNIQFIGSFVLKADDKITISVSKPNIVYGCKGCNQITVIKTSSKMQD